MTVSGPLLDRLVDVADDGSRVDRTVAGWLDEPRNRSQERLAAGEVSVDGRAASKSDRLRAGQRVVVAPPAPASLPVPPDPVPVRYADDDLLVVAKPAGLVVHAGAGVHEGTLVDALRGMGVSLAPAADDDPGLDRAGIVHRLDRGTSGLLIVAKTAAARDGLIAALRRRDVAREYWALVDGTPDPPRATVDAPIGRSASRRTRFAVDPSGRPAITHYDVSERHEGAAELVVRLDTGRTHQIRVHLSAIGHPVVGDRVYGASPLGAALGLTRPALHARRIAFVHPVTRERVEVTEPLPRDLERARAALREGLE